MSQSPISWMAAFPLYTSASEPPPLNFSES